MELINPWVGSSFCNFFHTYMAERIQMFDKVEIFASWRMQCQREIFNMEWLHGPPHAYSKFA